MTLSPPSKRNLVYAIESFSMCGGEEARMNLACILVLMQARVKHELGFSSGSNQLFMVEN